MLAYGSSPLCRFIGLLPSNAKAHRRGNSSGKIRRPKKVLVGMSVALFVCCTLNAQEESGKINSNVGAAVSLPLSPTSNFVKTSWGLVGGAGYNFSEHHSLIGELCGVHFIPPGQRFSRFGY